MFSISDVKHFKFKSIRAPNGNLGVVEATRDVPFEFRRLFFVSGVKAGETRGKHAHKECSQALICLHGRCEVVADDGVARSTYLLGPDTPGLLIPPTIWAEQKYVDPDVVLLVATDMFYSESDYIRDYQEFLVSRGT